MLNPFLRQGGVFKLDIPACCIAYVLVFLIFFADYKKRRSSDKAISMLKNEEMLLRPPPPDFPTSCSQVGALIRFSAALNLHTRKPLDMRTHIIQYNLQLPKKTIQAPICRFFTFLRVYWTHSISTSLVLFSSLRFVQLGFLMMQNSYFKETALWEIIYIFE